MENVNRSAMLERLNGNTGNGGGSDEKKKNGNVTLYDINGSSAFCLCGDNG